MSAFKTLAALVVSGAALCSVPASHASRPYDDGDLIMAFHNTTTTYLMNVGDATIFLNRTTPLTLDLNILGDLNREFGAQWNANGNISWGVAGVMSVATDGIPRNTIFLSAPHSGAYVSGVAGSMPWNRLSLNGTLQPVQRIQAFATRYQLGNAGATQVPSTLAESTLNGVGLTQPNNEVNSYRSYLPEGVNSTGASTFGTFVGNGIETNFGLGEGNIALDLYDIRPNSSGGPSTYAGSFTIDPNAVLTFTPAAVPEPAAASILAAGALLLGARRRRATAQL